MINKRLIIALVCWLGIVLSTFSKATEAQSLTLLIDQHPRIFDIDWTSDGMRIAMAFENGELEVVNLISPEAEVSVQISNEPATVVAFSSGEDQLAVGVGNSVYILDAESLQTRFILEGHSDTIYSLSWAHSTNQLISTSIGGLSNFHIWDAQTGQQIRSESVDQLSAARWSPDDSQIVLGSGLAVRIMDPVSGDIQLLSNQSLHGGVVIDVAWSPLGNQIASSSLFGEARIWNASTGELEHDFAGHTNTASSLVSSLVWSLDGVDLASVGTDGTIRIWNTATGLNFRTYFMDASSVDFSPFGGRIAIGVSLDAEINENTIQEFSNGALQIAVPDPTLERLQAIAALCDAPLTVTDAIPQVEQTAALTDFVAQVTALPEGTIPPACAADLIAVAGAMAEAISAGQ